MCVKVLTQIDRLTPIANVIMWWNISKYVTSPCRKPPQPKSFVIITLNTFTPKFIGINVIKTIGKWLSNIFWLWVEHRSFIVCWTSKLGWSSKVCCTNWYSQKCSFTNICTNTQRPWYMHTDKCYPIAYDDLPQVYGWDDLLKSRTKITCEATQPNQAIALKSHCSL